MLLRRKKTSMIRWRNIGDFLYLRSWRRISGKIFNKLKSFHLTIKFTAEYSKGTIAFLDVDIRLVVGVHDGFVY